MELILAILFGTLVVLSTSVTAIVRRLIRKVRANRLTRKVETDTYERDTRNREAALQSAVKQALNTRDVSNTVAMNFGTQSRETSGVLGQPAGLESTLRDQMAIDGVNEHEMPMYRSRPAAEIVATEEARRSVQSATPGGSSGAAFRRIQSLPPLKRAIVWSEILSPPVSERGQQ